MRSGSLSFKATRPTVCLPAGCAVKRRPCFSAATAGWCTCQVGTPPPASSLCHPARLQNLQGQNTAHVQGGRCTCMTTCVHVSAHVSVHGMCSGFYACFHVCIWDAHVHVCVPVNMYLWVHVLVHICTSVLEVVCMCLNTCMQIHVHMCVCASTHGFTCICACVHLHASMHRHV